MDETKTKKKQFLIGLIHKVYTLFLKNKRTNLAHTKTKAEVSGGGKKPWKQKGTGRARAGSIRSPLWKGGGVAFGPRFHVVKKKINKKERKIAIASAFFLKKKDTIIINNNEFLFANTFKTKDFKKILTNYNLPIDRKTLIILTEIPLALKLASQNLYYIQISLANSVNIEQLLNAKKILISNEALPLLISTYGDIF